VEAWLYFLELTWPVVADILISCSPIFPPPSYEPIPPSVLQDIPSISRSSAPPCFADRSARQAGPKSPQVNTMYPTMSACFSHHMFPTTNTELVERHSPELVRSSLRDTSFNDGLEKFYSPLKGKIYLSTSSEGNLPYPTFTVREVMPLPFLGLS